MNIKQWVFILVLIFSMLLNITASLSQGEWTTLQTTNTGSNGLSGNLIYDMTEDANHNIWFCSNYGVSMFDGNMWSSYFPFDSSITQFSVTDIAIDQDNNVWIGTGLSDGLFKFDGNSWTVYDESDSLIHKMVNDVCVDDDVLWIGTHAGISLFSDNNFYDLNIGDTIQTVVYNYETGQFDTVMAYKEFSIRSLAVDHDHNLWAAAYYYNGLNYTGAVKMYDGDHWTGYTPADGLIDSLVNCIAVDGLGNIWFGSNNGVSKYDHSSWTNYTMEDGLISNHVSSITADSSGAIWFGTSAGASKFDGYSWTDFTKNDGIISNAIISLFTDTYGNVWFGTLYGASMYNGSDFVNYSTDDGLINNCIRGIKESENGIWIATERGASFFDGLNWKGYSANNGLGGNYINVAFDDHNGNNWFGITNGPLTMINGVNDTIYGDFFYHVEDIIEDNSGNLWFGNHDGLLKNDGVNWSSINTDTLAPWGVKSLAADDSGDIWVGLTYGIIGKYNGSTWQIDTLGSGISNYHVKSIVIDSSGNVWSHAGSLFKFDGNNWIEIDSLSGFTNKYALHLAIDKNNHLWIGTPYGVTEYDGSSFLNYTKDDGLIANYISYVGVDNFNNKWFGNYKYGLSKYCESMSIDGSIDYQGNSVSNGTVFLYRSLDNSGLELVNSSSIETGGHYQFNITASGNYVVSASGDNSSYPNTIETYYHPGNYSCNKYEPIKITCGDLINNINISLADSGSIISSNFSHVNNGSGNYSFINHSTGNYNISHWAFGDGNTSHETHPNHTFSANGTFVVVLTVTDSLNGTFCFDYFIDTLTVTEVINPLKCVAGFVCFPEANLENVTVVNSSIGDDLSFLWDFGDGSSSGLSYPDHHYSSSGPFNLCLTVDDGAGCNDMYCDSIGSNGAILRQGGFSINVIPVGSTGIDNNMDIVPGITIFPNPAADYFTIKSDLRIIEAQVFSISGQKQKIIKGNFDSVNITNLPPGIYIIKCITGETTVTRKFIKQ